MSLEFIVKDRPVDLSEPILMGVLNMDPDSFSGDGITGADEAVARALHMVSQGATIIDIGGESSRPGSKPVSEAEEIDRVLPTVTALAKQSNVLISVDTYKPEVAEAALKAGAHIINDIRGLEDELMAAIVARYKAGIVIMHMQGTPTTMQNSPRYEDVTKEVTTFFRERIGRALAAGIGECQIILDPGIGFGKTIDHNLDLLRSISDFTHGFGQPLLIGASRKSFIGKLTGKADPLDRLFGTIAITAHAARDGAKILRVHDVGANMDALTIVRAISTGKQGK